ncbi:hypothetical protein GKE82_24050 [Conexibacter sp. W3-3-2]|uniref:hypothetical protein n=1 Tax=Conexibacter sp. W3-3-2 TaxID=2675227 RepID=UPI0012B7253A|nr:hypothetical protein [Conexibacter sp. W3-3-2]MTD47281.1 hypothetical protein [Conexibacter sp. W3-3-2]
MTVLPTRDLRAPQRTMAASPVLLPAIARVRRELLASQRIPLAAARAAHPILDRDRRERPGDPVGVRAEGSHGELRSDGMRRAETVRLVIALLGHLPLTHLPAPDGGQGWTYASPGTIGALIGTAAAGTGDLRLQIRRDLHHALMSNPSYRPRHPRHGAHGYAGSELDACELYLHGPDGPAWYPLARALEPSGHGADRGRLAAGYTALAGSRYTVRVRFAQDLYTAATVTGGGGPAVVEVEVGALRSSPRVLGLYLRALGHRRLTGGAYEPLPSQPLQAEHELAELGHYAALARGSGEAGASARRRARGDVHEDLDVLAAWDGPSVSTHPAGRLLLIDPSAAPAAARRCDTRSRYRRDAARQARRRSHPPARAAAGREPAVALPRPGRGREPGPHTATTARQAPGTPHGPPRGAPLRARHHQAAHRTPRPTPGPAPPCPPAPLCPLERAPGAARARPGRRRAAARPSPGPPSDARTPEPTPRPPLEPPTEPDTTGLSDRAAAGVGAGRSC